MLNNSDNDNICVTQRLMVVFFSRALHRRVVMM